MSDPTAGLGQITVHPKPNPAYGVMPYGLRYNADPITPYFFRATGSGVTPSALHRTHPVTTMDDRIPPYMNPVIAFGNVLCYLVRSVSKIRIANPVW